MGVRLFNSQTLLVWLGSSICTGLRNPTLPKSCLECVEGSFSSLKKNRNLVFAVLFEKQTSLMKSKKSHSLPTYVYVFQSGGSDITSSCSLFHVSHLILCVSNTMHITKYVLFWLVDTTFFWSYAVMTLHLGDILLLVSIKINIPDKRWHFPRSSCNILLFTCFTACTNSRDM